MNFDIY